MVADLRVDAVMSVDVAMVTRDTTIGVLAKLMIEHGFSGLPVVEDGALIGIVTEADVISHEINVSPPVYLTFLDAIFKLPWDDSDEELRKVLASTAGELMTEEVVTATPEMSIHEAATLMYTRKANPLPVVDDDGAVVGIISRVDIIRLIAESEAAAALAKE
jgi:CBS domain-containing protein